MGYLIFHKWEFGGRTHGGTKVVVYVYIDIVGHDNGWMNRNRICREKGELTGVHNPP